MACRLHHDEMAISQDSVHVRANRFGRNHVIGALENQRLRFQLRKVGPVIRQKRDVSDMFRYLRIRQVTPA